MKWGDDSWQREQDYRMLEAIVCALLVRAGGAVTLGAHEVMEAGNWYRLGIRADHAAQALRLRSLPRTCERG